MVLRRLAAPGASDFVRFANGEVVVIGIDAEENCPVVDTPLSQLTELFPDLKAVVVGILRDGRLFVPRSSDAMLVGDRVYVVCESGQVRRTLGIFGHEEPEAHRVVIAGGGNIGLYVARSLEARGPAPRSRSSKPRGSGRSASPTSSGGASSSTAAPRPGDSPRGGHPGRRHACRADQRRRGQHPAPASWRSGSAAGRTWRFSTTDPIPSLAGALGIDATVNPRGVTISKILQHVRRGRIRGVHTIENGLAEVIEGEALETSPLVGKPLRDLDLPDGIRVGAIYRGEEGRDPGRRRPRSSPRTASSSSSLPIASGRSNRCSA